MRPSIAIAPAPDGQAGQGVLSSYLEKLALIERLHRLMLDVIKDEFERLGHFDINAVQALLLFNIGDRTMTPGELRSRGYYQGTNVSYNVRKLIEGGYLAHRRCDADRRSIRLQLTPRGAGVRDIVADLFRRHVDELCLAERLRPEAIAGMNRALRTLERYWTEELRCAY